MATDGRSGGEAGPGASLSWEDRKRRREERRRQIRRRRIVALGGVGAVAVVAVVVVVLVATGGGGGSPAKGGRAADVQHHALPPPPTLPRGGRTLVPGHLIVAYYGIVGTTNILGQTRNPEADAAGVERQAKAYSRYGKVQPAFELVTTIASSDAGSDGTYSTPVDPALVSRYLRVAHRHKLLLVLDFQPGRGEFLPQVRRYAKFLRDPSVGVALDPEWKVTPDEVPIGQIGSASAASINAVSSYLSTFVRAHRLPQKLFIVHEFRLTELPDRNLIRPRPGLASVLQMDGLGPVAVKLAAYHEVQRGARGFHPGFKVFLRRTDDPVLLTPPRVMKLRPRPVYVSYQ